MIDQLKTKMSQLLRDLPDHACELEQKAAVTTSYLLERRQLIAEIDQLCRFMSDIHLRTVAIQSIKDSLVKRVAPEERARIAFIELMELIAEAVRMNAPYEFIMSTTAMYMPLVFMYLPEQQAA